MVRDLSLLEGYPYDVLEASVLLKYALQIAQDF